MDELTDDPRAMTTRMPLRTLRPLRRFWVLVHFMLAACAVLPAPYRVDLYRTTWTIETLGSEASPNGWEMAFNEAGHEGTAIVTTPCGRTQFSFGGDSDGDVIEFWGPIQVVAPECSDDESRAEVGLHEGLSATQRWEVHDDDHVTLKGDIDVGLERVSG